MHDFGQTLKYTREAKAFMCQNESILGTVFQANVTQTEQNSSIDKMKHLFMNFYEFCLLIL